MGRAERLEGLQYLRGLAALLVVLFHCAMCFGPAGYAGTVRGWEGVFLFGHAGVELFFVLSGFIICWVHFEDPPDGFGRYLGKRLLRIYPPVLIVVAAFGAVRLAGHMPQRPIDWFVSLTLIPAADAYFPPALWTLTHEMLFYLVFGLAFVSKRLFLAATALWGLAGAAVYFALGGLWDGAAQNALISPYNALFIMGVGAYFAARSTRFGPRLRWIAAGLGLTILAVSAGLDLSLYGEKAALSPMAFRFDQRLLTLIFGLGAMFLIAGLATRRLVVPGLVGAALAFLGDASYSIYLWHELAQRVLVRVLDRIGWLAPDHRAMAIILLFVAGVALGCAAWAFLDRPAMRFLRSRWRPMPA